MSNDSGISTNGNHELIGEPRLSMFNQNAAAAAAMFNMQASSANPFLQSSAVGLSSLWSHPLTAATLMHQQQEAARKVLESASGRISAAAAVSRPYVISKLTYRVLNHVTSG